MTEEGCLIQKSSCGLQAGNPVCSKCGLDTRVGGYTSQQAGEEARKKAIVAWDLAEQQEQAELKHIKAQEDKRQVEKERLASQERKTAAEAQRLAKEKAEGQAAERAELERRKAEEAKPQAEKETLEGQALKVAEATQLQPNEKAQHALEGIAQQEQQRVQSEKKTDASKWLPRVASFVAMVLVLGGIRVYRQMEDRQSQEIMRQTDAAMERMSRERVLASLGQTTPNKETKPLWPFKETGKSTGEPQGAASAVKPDAPLATKPEPKTAAVVYADPFSYWVQVNAFGSADDAESLRVKLSMSGMETKVSERERVFRVRAGPFSTKEDAAAAREILETSGFGGVLVRVQR